MLWDGGSQLSLITFETAKRLGLKGKPVKLGLSGVLDKSSSVDSRLYQLQALTAQGNTHTVEAFGVEGYLQLWIKSMWKRSQSSSM